MKKKTILIIALVIVAVIAAIIIIGVSTISQEDEQGLIFEYKDYQGSICLAVTGYKGTATEVTIPSEFKNDPVLLIAKGAFSDCDRLTRITISDSVVEIRGTYTDRYDTFPDGLAEINVSEDNANYSSMDGVLYNKEKTEVLYVPKAITGAVTLPDSLTVVDGLQFRERLTAVTIPAGVTSISSYEFCGCGALTRIEVAEGNANYRSIEGDLYTKDGETLLHYAAGKQSTFFAIPSNVSRIGDYAFDACGSLTSVLLPVGVTHIGKDAFNDGIESVYYTGTTIEDANRISCLYTVGEKPAIFSATWYFYSETEPTESGDFWHYDSAGNITIWES